jgi:hypothetical protein
MIKKLPEEEAIKTGNSVISIFCTLALSVLTGSLNRD